MKRIAAILLLCLCAGCTLNESRQGNRPNSSTPSAGTQAAPLSGATPTAESLSNPLAGTWLSGNGTLTYTFSADGTYVFAGTTTLNTGCELVIRHIAEGRYEVTENTLRLTPVTSRTYRSGCGSDAEEAVMGSAQIYQWQVDSAGTQLSLISGISAVQYQRQ